MRLAFLIIILVWTNIPVLSQSSGKDWQTGYLVLMNNDTLHGELIFDWNLNTLGFKNNKEIKAFTCRKIYYFEFSKNLNKPKRRFYVLPYALDNDYEKPVIFEILVEGNLSLLARTHLEKQVSAGSSFILVDNKRVRDFFFLKKDENIQSFSIKKPEILRFMSDHDTSVNEFLKKNKIKLKKESGLIELTEYYNSLSNEFIN